jgi:biopolymer transport protein ExbB/TolQ
MKFPNGLDTNDRLSWIIGVTARNETFLYLQSIAQLARLKGETRKFEQVRRSHTSVLQECRDRVEGHRYIDPQFQPDARRAIKRAEKAVKHRNDLVHKVWVQHDAESSRPKFTDWFASFDGSVPCGIPSMISLKLRL